MQGSAGTGDTSAPELHVTFNQEFEGAAKECAQLQQRGQSTGAIEEKSNYNISLLIACIRCYPSHGWAAATSFTLTTGSTPSFRASEESSAHSGERPIPRKFGLGLKLCIEDKSVCLASTIYQYKLPCAFVDGRKDGRVLEDASATCATSHHESGPRWTPSPVLN